MKKLLITGNIFLFVLLLMSYTNKDKTPDPPNTSIQLGIDPSLARHMLIEYREKIWRNRNINGAAGKDARSVWFSLDKLKAFIKDIEDKTRAGNCIESYGLGIRIYYANYPDSSLIRVKGYDSYFQSHNLPMEYKNHHTVVMVPTYWNKADGHNYDFDPRFRKKNGRCEFSSIKDVMSVLYFNKPYSDSTRDFVESLIIPNRKSFMIMPDNLDSRRFRKEVGFVNGIGFINFNEMTESKQRGAGEFETYTPPPSDFTNGGTLIPPPYPSGTPGDGGGGDGGGTGERRVIKSTSRKMHVPSSGASYMRWVDELNDTGWVELPSQNIKVETKKLSN